MSNLDHIKEKWASALKLSRVTQDLTHQQLAQKAGVSVDTISRMENAKSISLDAWLSIAMALGHHQDLMAVALPPKFNSITRHQEYSQNRLDHRRRVRQK